MPAGFCWVWYRIELDALVPRTRNGYQIEFMSLLSCRMLPRPLFSSR